MCVYMFVSECLRVCEKVRDSYCEVLVPENGNETSRHELARRVVPPRHGRQQEKGGYCEGVRVCVCEGVRVFYQGGR